MATLAVRVTVTVTHGPRWSMEELDSGLGSDMHRQKDRQIKILSPAR